MHVSGKHDRSPLNPFALVQELLCKKVQLGAETTCISACFDFGTLIEVNVQKGIIACRDPKELQQIVVRLDVFNLNPRSIRCCYLRFDALLHRSHRLGWKKHAGSKPKGGAQHPQEFLI